MEADKLEKIHCTIERITYRNEENGYSILKCSVDDSPELVAVIGYMAEPSIGSVMNFYGNWKIHPKFGIQFHFEKLEEQLPTTSEGMKKYLAGKIKGIGEVLAERIVKHFDEKTFEILDSDINRLLEIPGMYQKRLDTIKESWEANREINKIMVFLQSYGVTTNLATKIYNKYGKEAVKIVKDNPYRLADEIWGVGFKTADQIAENLGFSKEHDERIRSGILYTLNKLSEEGHCFSYINALINKARELLEIDEKYFKPIINRMIDNEDVILENIETEENNKEKTAIYLSWYYYAEIGTAKRLVYLINESRGYFYDIYHEDLEANSFRDAYGNRIDFDYTQLKAIQAATQNKVLVLTGGPGTGKTTTTLGIINAYMRTGAKILLAAPTGRAAKRMSEVTGMEAKTIHRLLEASPTGGFGRNEHNPISGDVLIVDECSMIDILLMNSLLKAIPKDMTLILVGDVDQLPSVGAGKVLSDIINSGVVPFIRLNKIFRQARTSKIITNAHRINQGGYLELDAPNSDFIFIEKTEPEETADFIVKLCADILPNEKGILPANIQVLSPMRRGVIGTGNLNSMLQNALNPKNISIRYGDTEFRVNDKVMQIRNNYEKEVFNGDIGFISEIDTKNGSLTVIFDDHAAKYESEERDEIVLAYATTIHKSQGSEFPYVVIPIMMSHYIMLQRNLLYTGVTRAKKGLFLVGEKRALFFAVKNNKIQERNTDLINKLRFYYE